MPQSLCFDLPPLHCALSTGAVERCETSSKKVLQTRDREYSVPDLWAPHHPPCPVGICQWFDICYSALHHKKRVRKYRGLGYGPEFPAGDPEWNTLTHMVFRNCLA